MPRPSPTAATDFEHTYQWTLGWGLVAPGATYENTVDNRRLAVVEFLAKSMTKRDFSRRARRLSFRTLLCDAAMVQMAHQIDSVLKLK